MYYYAYSLLKRKVPKGEEIKMYKLPNIKSHRDVKYSVRNVVNNVTTVVSDGY